MRQLANRLEMCDVCGTLPAYVECGTAPHTGELTRIIRILPAASGTCGAIVADNGVGGLAENTGTTKRGVPSRESPSSDSPCDSATKVARHCWHGAFGGSAKQTQGRARHSAMKNASIAPMETAVTAASRAP